MKHTKCNGKDDDDDDADKEIAVTPATHLGLAGHYLTLQIRLTSEQAKLAPVFPTGPFGVTFQ